MRFTSRNVRRSISSALLAVLAGCAPPGHGVAGRWQLSWRGRIGHEYSDHVSIDKFIERNWGTDTITKRSRDNFPNPITNSANPYVPVNSPAIDDLFSLFQFSDRE